MSGLEQVKNYISIVSRNILATDEGINPSEVDDKDVKKAVETKRVSNCLIKTELVKSSDQGSHDLVVYFLDLGSINSDYPDVYYSNVIGISDEDLEITKVYSSEGCK